MEKHGFIYLIENKENGWKYIGQTNDFARRWIEHCQRNNQPIDKAIDEFGWDSFKTKILETAPLNELDDLEKEYIEKYGTYMGEGYNCAPGGGTARGE